MTNEWVIGLLGTIAGFCTTGSFVPQVVTAWREGETGAISTRMYVIISGAFVLWLGYGLAIGSWPMVVFNVLNLGLSGAILLLKFRAENEPPDGLPSGRALSQAEARNRSLENSPAR
jgi:MtN3 and saliva related transmembrane protein